MEYWLHGCNKKRDEKHNEKHSHQCRMIRAYSVFAVTLPIDLIAHKRNFTPVPAA
jgi:hypothetical protein